MLRRSPGCTSESLTYDEWRAKVRGLWVEFFGFDGRELECYEQALREKYDRGFDWRAATMWLTVRPDRPTITH